MCDKIIKWILDKVKVSAKDVDEAMKKCDTNEDGYYSLGEIYIAIKEVLKCQKK